MFFLFRQKSVNPEYIRDSHSGFIQSAIGMRRLVLFKICFKEGLEFVEGNEIFSVVQVYVSGPFDNIQFFWFGSYLVGILGKIARMCVFTHDE